MSGFRRSFLLLVFLLGFAASGEAQFIGYTTPQTVQQTLGTNVACTGAAQLFPVNNLGQTQHLATATLSGAVGQFTMQFFGTDKAGNNYPISDIATVIPAPQVSNGVLQAVGYFPIIQIQVFCASGQTFTLNYAGSSSSPVFAAGGYGVAQYDKPIFVAQSQTGTSPNISVSSPTLNASGELLFIYSTAPSGAQGQLTLTCTTQEFTLPFNNATSLNFKLANVNSTQVFPVPAFACPFPSVQFSPPGTPNGTFSLEYVFYPTGAAIAADACASPGIPKNSVPINITSATTTSLIAPAVNAAIYVCGYNVSTAGGTFQLEYGTGATCGTGTTVLTGAYPAGSISFGGGSESVLAPTPAAQRLCAVTGVGLTNAQGVLTFVQQ